MGDKVFVLQVDSKVLGVFSEKNLAKLALADWILDLGSDDYYDEAAIHEHEIQDGKPSTNPLDYPDVVQAIKEHKKILAIKCYRQHTNLGLRESKEAVEAVEGQVEKNPIEPVTVEATNYLTQAPPRKVRDGEGDLWKFDEVSGLYSSSSSFATRTLDEINDYYDGYTVED